MKNQGEKFAFVDEMRGIAILMVILVHTSQKVHNLTPFIASLAQYGQMGVQLFFVASAYTLCISIERHSEESVGVLSFYLRRLFRIAPLYYFAILLYFLVHVSRQLLAFGKIITVVPYSLENVIANITFMHGLIPSANNNIVPGGWSIGTEMVFYLIFPLLFAFSKSIAKKHFAYLFALFLSCFVFNLVVQMGINEVTHRSMHINGFRYFNIVNQLPVFVLGIITYFLHKQFAHPMLYSRSISVFGFLFFSGIAVWLLNVKGDWQAAIIPIASAISFVFLLNWLKTLSVNSRIICKVGEVSYSMYVFHFIFAWLMVPTILSKLPYVGNSDIELLIAFLLTSILTFLVAIITQKFIEARGISIGARAIKFLQVRASDVSRA